MTVQRRDKGKEREFSWNSVPWESTQEAEAGEWQVLGLRYRGPVLSCIGPPSDDLMERLSRAAKEGPPAGPGSY